MKTEEVPSYEIIGNGKKTIVFVHYFGGDAGSWRWLAKRLRKKYRCVLLNLPGFGKTEPLKELSIFGFAKFINKCIKELQLSDYILCGHSMGAKLVLYAAKINEVDKPKSLILIAPSPPTVENMPEHERDRMLNHPNEEVAKNTVEGATKRKLEKNRFNYAVNSQLHIDENTWDWWLQTGMQHDIAENIKDLKIPTLVVYSKDDPVIEVDTIYLEVLPYLNNPSLIALSNIGHLIPMESPRKLARLIKKAVSNMHTSK